MTRAMAERLTPYPGLIGAAAALTTLIGGLNTALDTSLASSIVSVAVAVLLEVSVIGAALLALGGARAARPDVEIDVSTPGARAPWVLAALAIWLALAAALTAVLLGYLAFAVFVTRETVWIATILALLFLLFKVTDELFPAALSATSPLGRTIETATGLSSSAREQIAVLLSGMARLIFLLLAWLADPRALRRQRRRVGHPADRSRLGHPPWQGDTVARRHRQRNRSVPCGPVRHPSRADLVGAPLSAENPA